MAKKNKQQAEAILDNKVEVTNEQIANADNTENVENTESNENASSVEDGTVENENSDNENSDNENLQNEAVDNENTDNAASEEQATEETNKKDKKDLMIEELNDKYMRTFAEFDNFRKRTEKEKAAMFEIGAKSIVEKILPVVDNFERGFAMVAEDKMSDPFVEGMDKVYKQLMKSLEEAGVKPIAALGEEFNPDMHNAVMHIEDESVGENIIVEEFQKGYMYRESVVRYSMVKVAN